MCLIGMVFFTSSSTSKFFSQKASDIRPIALVESYFGVFALVFDSQTGEVVWYGSRPRRYEYNPIDRQSLTK